MTKGRVALVVVIVALVAAFFALGLQRYFSFAYFQQQRSAIDAYFAANPVAASAIFFAVYVAVTGLSLPGAAIMTLVAGALFGLVWGTVIVSFASSIGATLAFLASRFVLRDWVQARFGDKLKPINEGVEREGAFYLFALRLVPVFPFFVINLVMGLTPIRARTFYWASQAGMFAGTVAFVYAGTQLGQFRFSAGLIAAFVILGIFPLVAKKVLAALKARKVYARWKKPAKFERNLVVIGAGAAGLVSAYIAAAVKAKVTIVERGAMGGDCLNTGCVPSKALIRTAKLLADMRRARELGIRRADADFDFAEVMERVQRIVREVEPHDSVARYTKLGVECLQGSARISSPWTVEVALAGGGARTLTTKNIVIAAGGRPLLPPIPGLAEARPLTSENVWELRKLPRRLAVLGGGPIGCELAQCFARLGASGHPGRDGAAPHDARGPGVLRAGHRALPRRGRGREGRPQGEGGARRGRREGDHRRARGARGAHRVRRDPVRHGPRGQHHGLRARGAGHPGHEAEDGRGERAPRDDRIPTSTRAATWPVPTSSRIRRRTWRGTAR